MMSCGFVITKVKAPVRKKWKLVVREYQKFLLHSCLVQSFGNMKTNVCTFLGLAKVRLP